MTCIGLGRAEVAGRVLETSPAQTRVTLDRVGISHGDACVPFGA
jgi:hypothetical protein